VRAGATLRNPLAALLDSLVPSQVSVSLFDRKGYFPSTTNYSFAVQQQLSWTTTLEVAYNGTKGTHMGTTWSVCRSSSRRWAPSAGAPKNCN